MKFLLSFFISTLVFASPSSNRYLTGQFLKNGAGVYAIPSSGSDTLLGRITTDTIQNKSISGTTNTITNVPLTAGAGVTGVLPIANGGTGGNLDEAHGGTNGGLTVPYGGTGKATLTAHSLQVGNGVTAVTQLAVGGNGTVLTGVAASDPAFSATPSLGVAGATLGSIAFSGNTSGTITVTPQAAAGTYNFNLPITAGTNGYYLTSTGGGASAMTWSNPASTLPSGSVIMGAWTSCPSLTIAANGASLLRTGGTSCGGGACDNLFTAISTTYGTADGTHFNVPDMRGVFPRGAGTQTISAIVYAGTQGTSQVDHYPAHHHALWGANAGGSLTTIGNGSGQNIGGTTSTSGEAYYDVAPADSHQYVQDSGSGTETQPANISLLYCIYY